jgi:hypothetical protein
MTISARIAATVVVAVGALFGPAAALGETSKAGVVTGLEGSATIARTGLPDSSSLKVRDDVFVQDEIATADKSLARILLGGKATVTVRERSVVTITETPGKSVVSIASGKIAVAVAKERMKPGDQVEIRSPNAVAAIRGTVVIAEVDRVTGDGGAQYTTRWTVPRGVVEIVALDARPGVAPVVLTAGHQVTVTGRQASPVTVVPQQAMDRLSESFKTQVPKAPKAPAPAAEAAVRQAQKAVTDLTTKLDRAQDVKGVSREVTPKAQNPGQDRPRGNALGTPAAAGDTLKGASFKPEGDVRGVSLKPENDLRGPSFKPDKDVVGPSGKIPGQDHGNGPDNDRGRGRGHDR